MKVFISFSGETSKQIAGELQSWLKKVIQEVEVFYSEEDIEKGSRWQKELAGKLEKSSFGLVCITPDNLGEEWIAFESGALSKNLDNSRVIPILFGGLETSQLTGPLTQFNLATFNKKGMRRVIESIFESMEDKSVDKDTIQSTFQSFWPDFKDEVTTILKKAESGEDVKTRPKRDMLKEILELTRSINQKQSPASSPETQIDKAEIADNLTDLLEDIVGLIQASAPAEGRSFNSWQHRIGPMFSKFENMSQHFDINPDYIDYKEEEVDNLLMDKRLDLNG